MHLGRTLARPLLTLALLLLLAPLLAGNARADITSWNQLKSSLAAGGTITLTQSITCDAPTANGNYLEVPSGRTVTLDLHGYTIDRGLTNETARGDGQVISVRGYLTLNDTSVSKTGRITGGNTTEKGGGVWNAGTFIMNGGTITGNRANYGGGVCVSDNCAFTMTGGKIVGNSCVPGYSGGGVYIRPGATFLVSGSPVITDNTKDSAQNNVLFYGSSEKIHVNGNLTTDARISVTAGNATDRVDNPNNNYTVYVSTFFTDANSAITFNGNGATSGFMGQQSVRNDTTITLNANTFSRVGYNFNGWNTASNGSGSAYADQADVTPYRNLTLYAQWTGAALDGTVSVSGTPQYGETLTASLTNGNNTGTLNYAWKSGGTAVGTNSGAYTLTADDVGKTITCTVTSSVQTGSKTSSATAAVAKRALTVTALDQTYVYNGSIQGEGDPLYNDPAVIAQKVGVTGLLTGDALTVIQLNGQGTAIGEYNIVPQAAQIKNGGNIVTNGYEITYVNGKLTISAPPPPPQPPTPAPSVGGSFASAEPFKQKFDSPLVFDGGKVTIDPTEVGTGNTVTLTAAPDAGRLLASLAVDRIGGDPVELTDKGNGVYQFEMPGWRIAIDAVFTADTPEQPEQPEQPGQEPLPPGNLAGVVLSPQTITVNGAEAKVEAYNIKGTNYFMLRDLAALLRGTSAQFNVAFDASRDAVVVTRGAAYAGEVNASFSDRSRRTVPSYQSVEIDGKAVELTAYNIGGNNFFGLRELAPLLGCGVDYDEATNTAIIESSR